MKKIVFLSITFLSITTSVSAQYGLRVYNFQPTGKDGIIFKPTITAEIGYIEPFDERFRQTAFLTMINLKTTIPEIPSTGYIESGGDVTITPGYQVFDKFLMFQLRAGYDYAFIKKEKWNTFVGANIILGATYVDYTSEIELIESYHITTLAYGIGVQFRVGIDYQFSETFGVFINVSKDIYFILNEDISDTFWSNEFGLGITYNF